MDNFQSVLNDGLLSKEGIDVFNRIMARDLSQVIVSTKDLALRIEENEALIKHFFSKAAAVNGPLKIKYSRPDLETPYTAPTNKTEQEVVFIWGEVLGIDKIGIHDNFFDLGGDSLKVIQLNGKLTEAFALDIPIVMIYKYLTIHSFVEYIEELKTHAGSRDKEKRRMDVTKNVKANRAKRRQKRRDRTNRHE